MRTVARGIPAASEDIPPVISGSDYLTFLLPHCGPCDNFCYLGHIKKLVDDDDDDDDASYCCSVAAAETEVIRSLLQGEDAIVMPIVNDALTVEVGINLVNIIEVVCIHVHTKAVVSEPFRYMEQRCILWLKLAVNVDAVVRQRLSAYSNGKQEKL